MPGLPQTWEKWANFTLHSPQVVAAKPIEGALLPNVAPRMGPLASLASVVVNSYQPTWSRRFAMASSLKRVRVAPKGMGLNDFVAMQEDLFAAEGLDVEF